MLFGGTCDNSMVFLVISALLFVTVLSLFADVEVGLSDGMPHLPLCVLSSLQLHQLSE